MPTDTDILAVVSPADDVSGPPQGRWTSTSYARIPEDGRRYEVVEGVLYMVPGPGEAHQSSSNLFQTYLTIHVQFAGLGRVYGAPFDLELAEDTVVQPDVMVVLTANANRITPRGIAGPPDLIVEIASPNTATHDRAVKLPAYERAGVPEYWIVDPHARTIEVLVLEENRYRSLGAFQGQALLPSTVVPGLPVAVKQFFE